MAYASEYFTENNDKITQESLAIDQLPELKKIYEGTGFDNFVTEGDTTTLYVSEQQMVDYLDSQGVDVPDTLRMSAMSRAAGRFAVVWRGPVYKGNVDLFLPQSWLNNLAKGGTGGTLGYLGYLLPGGKWKIALGAISKIINVGNFKHGRVFVIRGFAYQYWYYQ